MTGLLAKPFCIKEFTNLMKKCSENKKLVASLSKEAISYSKNFNHKKRTEIFFQTILDNTNLKSI